MRNLSVNISQSALLAYTLPSSEYFASFCTIDTQASRRIVAPTTGEGHTSDHSYTCVSKFIAGSSELSLSDTCMSSLDSKATLFTPGSSHNLSRTLSDPSSSSSVYNITTSEIAELSKWIAMLDHDVHQASSLVTFALGKWC